MFKFSLHFFRPEEGDLHDSFGSATVLKSAKVTSRNLRMREPNRVVQPSSELSVASVCTLSLASACHSAARYNNCIRTVLYGSSRSPSNTGIAHCTFIGHCFHGARKRFAIPVAGPRSHGRRVSSSRIYYLEIAVLYPIQRLEPAETYLG